MQISDRVRAAPNREVEFSPGPNPRIDETDWRAAMQSTEWRPVVGYERRYCVSSAGEVVGPRGHALRGHVNRDGYHQVGLWKDGRIKMTGVHRIVARAFIGEADGLEVRHMDGNARNNVLTNLRYGTHAENMRDVLDYGQHPNRAKNQCAHGHVFSAENTYITPEGFRHCRTCNRHRSAESRARKGSAA